METRLVLLVLLGASGHAQTATFTPTGNMITPRFGHTATLLQNGKVLITGGNAVCYLAVSFFCGASLQPDRAELYDPATGTFTLTSGMSALYNSAVVVLLPNGKVLLAGYDSAQMTTGLELYDPSTDDFSTAGTPATLATILFATLLSDGRGLLIGAVSPAVYGAELYDPVSGKFSPITSWPGQQSWPPVISPYDFALVALADGTALFVSSYDYESESERYDPATDAFRATGSIGNFQMFPLSTLLPNGNVLFTGGLTDLGIGGAELYDSAAGTFSGAGRMSTYRHHQSATLLPNGTVLVAGGAGQSGSSNFPVATAEIYDPATGSFSTAGRLTSARYGHTATLLNNGRVLITGGAPNSFNLPIPAHLPLTILSSAEIYTPDAPVPAPALFTTSDDGRGQGAIWHSQSGQIASPDNPAVADEALSMYTTNLTEGSVISPMVIIGGRIAQVLYFGAAPGYPGYYQVNFRIPGGVPPGPAVPVHLMYIGRFSNEVTVGVQ
jgi:hypothetical protein